MTEGRRLVPVACAGAAPLCMQPRRQAEGCRRAEPYLPTICLPSITVTRMPAEREDGQGAQWGAAQENCVLACDRPRRGPLCGLGRRRWPPEAYGSSHTA